MLGSARAGVRKTVTVLFADARSGGGYDDLELDVRAHQQLYDLMREVLRDHGGTVERNAGDAVMAVFGVPAARDDDARRAAAAAMELHAAVRSLPGEVHLAIGINTGEVLAGDASEHEELAVGDAVVVAARLQQQAAPGETLLGPGTVALLQGAVRVGAAREVQLRGRVGSLAVVSLLGLLPVGASGPRTPFVGRAAERHMVHAAIERSVKSGVVQLVTVFGEAGTGKSRLLEEVLLDMPGVRVARGTCQAYGEASTWSALGEVLTGLTGAPSVVAGMTQLGRTRPDLRAVWRVLSSLLGEGQTPVSASDLAPALARLLSVLSEDEPLVVVLEDLHAAAGPLLDLVPEVVRRLDAARIAVVVSARPELLEHRPGWGQALRHVIGLTLRPLPDSDARLIAETLLPDDEGGVDLVLAGAGGNPLFVEQLAKAHREGADISDRSVAPTLGAVLAARLDRLPMATRGVLERAAIIGSNGDVEDLVPLFVGPAADLDRELSALADRDLIVLHQGTWVLNSEQVREVTVAGIARDERAALHELRAAALGARGVSAAAGFHYEQAALLLRQSDPGRSGELAEQGASRLAAAGLRALSGDLVAACDLLERAISLLPVSSARRLSLLTELARGRQLTGDLSGAQEALDEAVLRCAELGLSEAGAHARLALVDLRRSTDPDRAYAEVPALLDEVLPTLEAVSDDRGLSVAYQLQASALQYRVRWAAMAEPLDKAVHHAMRAGDRRLVELAQSLQVGSMFHGPMPSTQTRARLEDMLAQPGGSPWHTASVMARLGGTLALQGDPQAGRELLEQVRSTFRDLGRELSVLATAFISGPIEMLAGAPERAAVELEAACVGLQRMGDRAFASTIAALLAEARWRCEDQTGAAAAAALSRRLADADDVISQVRWRCVQAKLEAVRRNTEHAQRLSSEAVQLVLTTDELTSKGDVLCDAAEVQLLLGDRAAAEVLLKDALDRYDRKQAPQAAAVARLRLGL